MKIRLPKFLLADKMKTRFPIGRRKTVLESYWLLLQAEGGEPELPRFLARPEGHPEAGRRRHLCRGPYGEFYLQIIATIRSNATCGTLF